MAVVGLFYGSDTGNTENIAKMIQKQLGNDLIDIRDIAKSSKEDIEAYDFLLFGIPTWYYGEAQADWDDFFPTLEEIDFTDKLVGIFGLISLHFSTITLTLWIGKRCMYSRRRCLLKAEILLI